MTSGAYWIWNFIQRALSFTPFNIVINIYLAAVDASVINVVAEYDGDKEHAQLVYGIDEDKVSVNYM